MMIEPLLPRAMNFQRTPRHVDLVDLNIFSENRSRAALLVSAMAIQHANRRVVVQKWWFRAR